LELPEVKLSGGAAVSPGSETKSARFDLTLSVTDLGQELAVGIEYSQDLFEAGTIERLINHYKNVLEGAVKDSERPIWSLDLLSAEERKQIIEEWNAAEADYPKEKLIHELFEEQVERSPDAVALVYEEQSLTYGELNAKANRLAHHLHMLGVGPDARVAICLERGIEMVVAMMATLKAGGAYVPLDPDYPSERLAYMLEDSNPAVLLARGAVNSALAARLLTIPRLDLEIDETQWVGQSEQNLGLSATGSDARSLAYIIYTSGSTGLPKGAMNVLGFDIKRLVLMQEVYGLVCF
jgi:non-ribosomal peptide synthetase component F